MIMRKLIVPLWDIRLQRNAEELRSEEMCAACKVTKKSISSRSQVENESDSAEVENENDSSEEDDDTEDSYSEEDNENEDPNYEEEIEKKKGPKSSLKVKKEADNSEEDGIEDPDYKIKNYRTVQQKKIKKKTAFKAKRNLTTYEQMIQKNREESLLFLQSLKIEEAKADLSKAIQAKPKRKYVYREKIKDPPIVRKSRRLENFNIDLSEEALIEAADKKNTIAPEFSFKEAFKNEYFYERYVADVPIQESKSEAKFITYDKSDLEKMTVKKSNVVKIVSSMTDTLAWYPLAEQLILAVGDLKGNLGVWNVNGKSDPYVMKIHLEGITNLQFNPFDPVKLVSSSSDGKMRCGDMVQHKFNTIYNVDDETGCTYFDILSASTFLVSQMDGQVALVDRRTNRSNIRSLMKKHNCHDSKIRSVNIHPVNRNFFVTAANNGSIRLWDLRKLQKKPVSDIAYHKKCVHSAFFSPITGNSLLATSSDSTVSIFDSSSLTSEIKLKNYMWHGNKIATKRGRATWLPNSEEAFMIGSNEKPPKIEVFDKDMLAYSIMKNENFTLRTPNNAFHPTRCALAGASYNAVLFVFT